ncbi:hypothetical protein HXX76_016211 [Chlamydomonas incerta]|uniref:Tubulin/FtsZ 2-layer sandwich domain-containing protein n=1 Tax=Chlamydomonas incerta TaxID=51695 RepID=A0A835SLK1_CHLIN|nr:hypothetical protein HXX76_016211 [Chlamydomonas incerta]|eukprot:KAG2422211.1 hypothetical protein HXX76_016211 [Chlamydomonas incerta]
MAGAGSSLMGQGYGSGPRRASDAALRAISSPLLEVGIERATGVVWNITGPPNMTLHEVNEAAEIIYDMVDPNANLIFGAVVDSTLPDDTVSITIIATGFGHVEPELGALADRGSRAAAAASPRVTAAANAAAAVAADAMEADGQSPRMLGGAAVRSLMVPPAALPLSELPSVGSAGGGVEIPAFLRRRRVQGK